MGTVAKISKSPVRQIGSHTTIQQAAESMNKESVGAMAVVEGNKLVGILSERDVVRKVIAKSLSPESVRVSEVMSTPVRTVIEETSIDEALRMMHEGGFRHLPVLDRSGNLCGMVSVRDLLMHRIHELALENKDLAAFISADGPGG